MTNQQQQQYFVHTKQSRIRWNCTKGSTRGPERVHMYASRIQARKSDSETWKIPSF